jgi:hypothetical protein
MKKESKASKIMKYIASHPTAKARDVAKAIKVSVDSVYQATYLAKKQVKSLPMTAIKPSLHEQGLKNVAKVKSLALFSNPPKRGRPFKLKTKAGTYTKKNQTTDNVNHPPHYKAGGIETIDFIEAKSLNYNLGNVVKYITRADHKGNKLEDLQKAQWYLNREIKNLSK